MVFHMSESYHVSDYDLNRYQLGGLKESELKIIEEHLLWCHPCIERAKENLRSIQEKGRAHLGHATTEDLESYHLGRLKLKAMVAIRKHAEACQECADRFHCEVRLQAICFCRLIAQGPVNKGFHAEQDVLRVFWIPTSQRNHFRIDEVREDLY